MTDVHEIECIAGDRGKRWLPAVAVLGVADVDEFGAYCWIRMQKQSRPLQRSAMLDGATSK
jgi:hypothetical protein